MIALALTALLLAPAAPQAATTPLDDWLANPTFTCETWQVPGWLGDDGTPTSCVDNAPCPEAREGLPCPGDLPAEIPAPVVETPVPVIETPAPIAETPAPDAETPAPAPEVAAPAPAPEPVEPVAPVAPVAPVVVEDAPAADVATPAPAATTPPVTLSATPTGTSASVLAETGSDSLLPLGVAGIVLAVGAALVALSARARRRTITEEV
jgi:hypothetical protein